MSFAQVYPLGYLPILALLTQGLDSFPILTTVDSSQNISYNYPLTLDASALSLISRDVFQGLGLAQEQNYNLDITKFSFNLPRLILYIATIINNLYKVRNTLTYQLYRKFLVRVIQINFTNIVDSNIYRLALFKDKSAQISIVCTSNTYTVTTV